MTIATAVVVFVAACGITEVGGDRSDDISDPVVEDGIGGSVRSVCCVTGMEYPGGYDWTGNGSDTQSRCSLVVFADGVPAMRIPVGDGYEVSPDPEMHRMYDGNIYTFFSKDGNAVVKRNGKPFFRYEGDEVLSDMLVHEGDVHTLTRKRSGGFAYRKNGAALVERYSGDTFGQLWEDGDSVCFAFCQPVAVQGGMIDRYYLSVNSTVTQVTYESDVVKVWDIRSRHGLPVSLLTSLRYGSVMLCKPDGNRAILLPFSAEMMACRMFDADNKTGVECVYSYGDGTSESGLWIDGAEYIRFETGRSIYSFRYSDGHAYCVLNPENDAGMMFDAGELVEMPMGYHCIGSGSLCVHKGEMYVALSSDSGERPVIWHDGGLDTLRMNGYVCSVSFTGREDDY